MSWIEKLYLTYQNNIEKIGDGRDRTPLLPLFHTTKKRAHVEIVLDGQGAFKRAAVIADDDAKTILPATEDSAGRTSGEAPHPLADQLQYVASEYRQYGGKKKHYFEAYKKQLGEWAEYGNPKIRSVFQYISKGTLISDLIRVGVLKVDEQGKLLTSWKGKPEEKPDIFRALGQGQNQTDVFVRWCVEIPGSKSSELLKDRGVWQSWADFYLSTRDEMTFCFITGASDPGNPKHPTTQYPRMIRTDGDGAKLISSNDTSGFTYRGRFTDEQQVCDIDVVVAQGAHNALRWLIARQGKVFFVKNRSKLEPRLGFVAWAVSGAKVPDPLADSDWLLSEDSAESSSPNEPITVGCFTAQEFGVRFSKLMSGYSVRLGMADQIIVMGIDSATPGRMAVTYYRELAGSDFLERVKSWHEGSAWLQRFSKDKTFYGAASPVDIAEAAYGVNLDDNLKKATVERLIPCIIEGVPVPFDIVVSCVRNATRRQGLPEWAWEKTLGITCGLYRYCRREKEKYTMGLDRERRTRDYLYGRLLAVADCIESWALRDASEKRPTNAARLMQRFADHPFQTWRTIELSLSPYIARMGGRINKHLGAQQEVMNLFDVDDFKQDGPLTGEFLLGFHCQRAELLKSTKGMEIDKEDGDESDE